jgi:formate dehydrogenase subunit delta
MDNQKMVHQVNEIARFFQAYTEEEAVAGIATHVTKFWERRYKTQLLDYVAAGGEGLHPLAVTALKGLAEGGGATAARR